MTERYDVVCVGSGYGGSVPAARLAEGGMSVLVLERGLRRGPSDFRQSNDLAYIQGVIDVVVSTELVAFRSGKLVGGASLAMDGAHFRMPSASFEVTDALGRRYWPEMYDRALLDPYYEVVETLFRLNRLEWSQISRAGGLFAKMLALAGASCERAPMNYVGCLECGFCSQGCIFGAKQTLLETYVPIAEEHGAVYRAGCEVSAIEPSGTGFTVRYAGGGESVEVWGQRVIVACGGIHSAALLLRSRAYLAGLSDQVGRNFNNNGEHAYVGILPPDFDDLDRYACYKGRENAALLTFHWWDEHGFTLHPGGGIEPAVLAARLTAEGHDVLPSRSWGLPYKRFAEEVYPHRLIGFSTLGLTDGPWTISLRSDGSPDLSRAGNPVVDDYLDRVESVMAEIQAASGVTLVPGMPREMYGMTSAHHLSACRMAESAQDGVVDSDCQVFGYENLYCCDASAIPYALGVNPALTISAVAERAAEGILARG